ncbi:hypothetical protein [Amycolatopsis thermoflava]|uniref:hypothetical protein n=1 Tax=Amycolatopsis thermoflava TaxID=84480 RepID=UPI000480A140|nr:hypothetical protein [Amycolatopsis thermoflava]
MSRTFKSTDIAAYLEWAEGISSRPVEKAAREIARTWSDHEFWWSATLAPLEKAALDSPAAHRPAAEILDRLQRHFHVFIHNVPEWEPQQ